MTAPAPSVCARCHGEGAVGSVTRSWCPDCRCVMCGTPVVGGGFCEPCDRDDMGAHDEQRERRAIR